MLEYARAKLETGRDIEWREADAQNLPFDDSEFGAVVCGFGIMFVPDRQAALREVRRVLIGGGIFLFSVWDRIEENPHALTNANVLEALFPGDPDMKFRLPYDMGDPRLLDQLLADAGFRATRIETKRIAIAGADPRSIATGQIRGTPRAALIQQRGLRLEAVIDKVTDALTIAGGDPYSGQAQAVIVQAMAI
jgi:SAM-dependent methyltransferase